MKDLDTAWEELEPWLSSLESDRKSAVRRLLWSIPIAIGAAVIIGGSIAVFGGPEALAAILGVVAAAGIFFLGANPFMELRKTVKVGLNERLASCFGLTYRLKPGTPVRSRAYRDHGLIPHSDRQRYEDGFEGELHGVQFELCEAELKQRRRNKNRTYYVTVFRGALIRIRFPRTIDGVTLVTRDKGWFNALEGWGKKTFGQSGRKLERIGLVDPKFEKLFEVYGTDQVMARYLLTPSFMERLLELETLLKGKNVRCVFDEALAAGEGEGELLIAAETGNLFEPTTLFSPLNTRSRVEAVYADVKLIEDIAGTLLESPDASEARRSGTPSPG